MLNHEGYKDLGSFSMYFVYSPKERWIGIKNWGRPEELKEEWKHRVGKKQLYLLQLIPCLGLSFHITRWTSTKKEVKKKK